MFVFLLIHFLFETKLYKQAHLVIVYKLKISVLRERKLTGVSSPTFEKKYTVCTVRILLVPFTSSIMSNTLNFQFNELSYNYDIECLSRANIQRIDIGHTHITLDPNTHFPRLPNGHISNINEDVRYHDLPLARHHVIPYNLFINFFSVLNTIASGNDENAATVRRMISENIDTIAAIVYSIVYAIV